MEAELNLVTNEEKELNPVGEARKEPEPLSLPKYVHHVHHLLLLLLLPRPRADLCICALSNVTFHGTGLISDNLDIHIFYMPCCPYRCLL